MLDKPDLNKPVYMLMLSKLVVGLSNDKEALEREMQESNDDYSLWRLVRI